VRTGRYGGGAARGRGGGMGGRDARMSGEDGGRRIPSRSDRGSLSGRSRRAWTGRTRGHRRGALVGDGLEELERGEQQLGAAVDVRLGETVNEAALGRGRGGAGVERVPPFDREGWATTVADETLDARPVLGLDAHGGVDPDAARALHDPPTAGARAYRRHRGRRGACPSNRVRSYFSTTLTGRRVEW